MLLCSIYLKFILIMLNNTYNYKHIIFTQSHPFANCPLVGFVFTHEPWIWVLSSVPTNQRVTFVSFSAAEVKPMSRKCEPVSHSTHQHTSPRKTATLIQRKHFFFIFTFECFLFCTYFWCCLLNNVFESLVNFGYFETWFDFFLIN